MERNVMRGSALWNAKGEKIVHECKKAHHGKETQRVLITTCLLLGAFLLIGVMVTSLWAQSYPNKPIRLILPYATGGGADIVGRLMAPKLAERLGQPIVPENRAGAGGNVGVEYVSKAQPDGYTLILATAATTISPSIYKKLNYDMIKDFEAISLIGRIPSLMIVRPTLPVKDLKEFVVYAKAHPGKLNFTSGGVGSPTHLAGELLKSLEKIDVVHVAYKGVGPGLIALMSGEVDMMMSNSSSAMPQIQSGKVKALAVLSDRRLPELPDVPTAKESGIENCETYSWYGLLAPAKTPRNIIERLNAEWTKLAPTPDIVEKMHNVGVEPMSNTPAQFSQFIKTETARWAEVIQKANIPKID